MASCAQQHCFTLHYFNGRGRAELIRYLFAFSKMPYTDKRYTQDEWKEFKPNAPLGQVPLLECSKDGHVHFLCQSSSIVRHVARITDLAGKCPQQQARADESYETLKEILEFAVKIMFAEDDAAKKEKLIQTLKNEQAPRILGFLEKRVQENGGKNLAGGEGYTYADMFVAQFFDRPYVLDAAELATTYPGLGALAKAINESPDVAAYLAQRPETPF